MGKRKICQIAQNACLLTSATCLAIGTVPSLLGDFNKAEIIIGLGASTAFALTSIFPHNVVYNYELRDKQLEEKKKSDTYKKSLLKEYEKMDVFGYYVIDKTKKYSESIRAEIFNDFDSDMKVIENQIDLLKIDDQEKIDELYDEIDRLNSCNKSYIYLELKDAFYKSKSSSVIEFNQDRKKESNNKRILKLVNTNRKTGNDDKE